MPLGLNPNPQSPSTLSHCSSTISSGALQPIRELLWDCESVRGWGMRVSTGALDTGMLLNSNPRAQA